MSSGSTISGSDLGRTYGSRRPGSKSESEYLAEEARQAQAAISATFKELRRDLLKGADPRLWVNAHPWATLAVATVGGFAAAAKVVPSKEQQALKRLAKLEQAIHADDDCCRQERRKEDRGMVAKIFSRAMGALEPALMNLMSDLVAEKVTRPDAEDIAAGRGREEG